MILQRQSRARIVVVGSPYVFDPKTFLRFRGLYGERPSAPVSQELAGGNTPPLQLVQFT